jgi:lipopolysaccharide transport system ATP-binding protein
MRDAIVVQNLGKRFSRYHSRKPVTLMEAALTGLRRIQPIDDFWALRGVCFEVAAGEMLGIIGHNGAGKSTLLQLLGQITCPTEGRLKMNGRIGALLDLGAGFHGELTGRENVFVTAIVAGLSRREVSRRFDQIVQFAELEGFIDNPVRTYSSGMMMRLAFSVAIHTDPQILLVDEFLAVGDLAFQSKCVSRIAKMKEQGCAIVFVSHSVGQVEQTCDRVLWLRHGQVAAYGEPKIVAGQYESEMRSQTQQRTPDFPSQMTRSGLELKVNENRFGSLDVEILDVQLLPDAEIRSGDSLCVEIKYQAHRPIETLIFSVEIREADGQVCLNVNTQNSEVPTHDVGDQGMIKLYIDRLDLSSGNYFVNVGVYEKDWSYAYDYHWQVYPLLVNHSTECQGILCPPYKWEVVKQTSSRTVIR